MFYRNVLAAVCVLCVVSCQGDLSRGFGGHINWKSLDAGLQAAKTSGKPLMVLIHKSYCAACHELSPKFAASPEIAELAPKFEMVNISDDEEPQDPKYAPDGDYVPRILYFGPQGEPKSQVFNAKSPQVYRHYYYDVPSIVQAMKSALN
ncbi:thioredoxin domain-containing protein 12-like [Diaphorina citri]|uniref:Thioredoxin domain-containing protein 12-like n=1 Tax=Diaphorina citri TaxID=121845 RepID=A0A1S3DJV4_DIACI|nr:thioredoxin domain-containing protein 12-like [Diaphorina citri]KAI5724894.1 hypothetical protein M8J77_008467 [Diaphorina citri]